MDYYWRLLEEKLHDLRYKIYPHGKEGGVEAVNADIETCMECEKKLRASYNAMIKKSGVEVHTLGKEENE